MAALIDPYPDMKLIIAHLGSMEHVDAIANARYLWHEVWANEIGYKIALQNAAQEAVAEFLKKTE